MYDKVKYLGIALKRWRDDVFKNMFSLGELYRMVQDGIDLSKLAPSTYVKVNMP